MQTNKIKAIIFDFDGVIAESVNVKTEAFSKIYAQYGSDIAEKVVEYHLSHGGISRFEKFKFYHKEYLGIELTNHQLKELGNKFSELVVQKVINAPYVPGALEFIQDNSHRGCDFHNSLEGIRRKVFSQAPKEGVLLEFGVNRGKSIHLFSSLLMLMDDPRTIFGFDNFAGLTEDWTGM